MYANSKAKYELERKQTSYGISFEDFVWICIENNICGVDVAIFFLYVYDCETF